MNSNPHQPNLTVRSIYAGWRHYQIINGLDYGPEGQILEVSAQESKCWLLDATKLYSQIALRECLIAGILCNDSHLEKKEGEWIVIGNPIEGALIAAGSKAKLYQSSLKQLMPKLDTISSESEFQYMATLHLDVDGKTIYIKGSPEEVLPRAKQTLDANGNLVYLYSELVKLEVEFMTKEGLQVFAFAKKQVSAEKASLEHADLESGFIFLGLQGIDRSSSSGCDRFEFT
jgi:Ca2+-transporting ATPase